MSVSFSTNAGRLAARKRLLANQVRGNLRASAQAHADKMKATAEMLSRGTLTPAQKRRMGYPYSVRLGANAAGQPDYVVNQVSGRFAASWRTRVQQTQKGWTITLMNVSPESRYLLGTSRMRVRPILEETLRRTAADLPARVRKVTRNAAQSGSSGSELGGIVYAFVVGASSVARGLEAAF